MKLVPGLGQGGTGRVRPGRRRHARCPLQVNLMYRYRGVEIRCRSRLTFSVPSAVVAGSECVSVSQVRPYEINTHAHRPFWI